MSLCGSSQSCIVSDLFHDNELIQEEMDMQPKENEMILKFEKFWLMKKMRTRILQPF